MVKLFSRALLLLVIVGLGVQEGKLFGMQQGLRQRGAAAQQQAQAANLQIPVVLSEQEKKAARLAAVKQDNELMKEENENKKLKEAEEKRKEKKKEEKRDEEVQARVKILKGLYYGLLLPGAALYNYNIGNFGANQYAGVVMIVVLTYYGVIHAFLVCLSEGVQHVKQIPFRTAINLIRPGQANGAPVNTVPVVNDPLGKAFESDSESDSE